MTDFEKIEKLRQHADVTFEEAKEALDAVGGDILDAMIWLERHGKAKAPSESVHSTKYEDQSDYVSVSDTVKQTSSKKEAGGSKFVNGLKQIWWFFTGNYFVVSRNGEEIAVLPLLLVLILILISFFLCLAALVVMLFFGFRYSFRGRNKLDGVNEAMDKASAAASGLADKVKEDFQK